jgi:hypothetical protein
MNKFIVGGVELNENGSFPYVLQLLAPPCNRMAACARQAVAKAGVD